MADRTRRQADTSTTDGAREGLRKMADDFEQEAEGIAQKKAADGLP